MNVLGLCAGVGGLELGIRIAEPRARNVCLVEREAYAAADLAARMEDGWLHPAPIWSDIGTFDPDPWRGVVHCVASGDPCQPNSVAGKRGGASDDRWLIDQVLRVVDRLWPDRVFRENVTGNADGQLAALVPALEGMGYRVAAGIFSAAEVGASHRRERLFVMADRDSDGRPADAGGAGSARQPRGEGRHDAQRCGGDVADAGGDAVRFEPERDQQGQAEREHTELGETGPAVADASEPGLQGSQRAGASGERHRPETPRPASEFCLPLFAPGPSDPLWVEILGHAPHFEPAVCRVADGPAHELDPRRAVVDFEVPTPEQYLAHALRYRVDRLRACGNAVVPLAAAYAWRTLEAALQAERAAHEREPSVSRREA